jgi:ankyrin repeat protein
MRHSKSTEKSLEHQLRDAASSGNLTELKRLVQEGVPVNDRSSFNNTALLYAAMHGKCGCLRFLIDNGADVNIANNSGYTPLLCAAKIGDYEAVKMLLDAGAETWHTLKDEDNPLLKSQRTALSLAERNGHQRVVELLSGVGALQAA